MSSSTRWTITSSSDILASDLGTYGEAMVRCRLEAQDNRTHDRGVTTISPGFHRYIPPGHRADSPRIRYIMDDKALRIWLSARDMLETRDEDDDDSGLANRPWVEGERITARMRIVKTPPAKARSEQGVARLAVVFRTLADNQRAVWFVSRARFANRYLAEGEEPEDLIGSEHTVTAMVERYATWGVDESAVLVDCELQPAK